MDPQDIALAQQAGFLGPQPPVVGPSPMPEADPLGVDRPNPFGPVLTPQLGEADLSFLPPLEGTAAPAPEKGPVSKSASKSVSTSSGERGFSPEKFAQVRKGPGGEVRRDLAAIPGQVAERYAPARAELGDIADQTAGALELGQEATLGQLTEKGKHQEDLALLERNHMWKMKAAQENAALESQAAMMKHRAAVEDWAASNVNPGAIFDQAGGFNSFGMGVAAFVHDFLGAKGVKTSAMDTFNRAQEMNIQAQVENIRKKGQVASAFKELWENVRLQSATEQEAMTRLHGYSLRAAEAQLTADMGKYDSKLAQAKHLAALQEIRKARLDNEMQLQRHIDTVASNDAKLRMDLYETETKAAMAAADRSHATRQAEAQRQHQLKLAEMSNKPAKSKRQVIDPLTNRGILRFKDGVQPTEEAKVVEMVAKYEPAAKAIKEMRELSRKMGASVDVLKGTRMDTEDRRNFHGMALEFAHQMLAATGERATDKDIEQMMKSLESDTTLTRGYTGKVLARFENHLHNKMKGYTRQYLEDTPLEEQEVGSQAVLNEDQALESEASYKNSIPKENDPKNPVGYTKYVLGSPDAFKAAKLESATKILTRGEEDASPDAWLGANASFGEFLASESGDVWEKNIGKRRLGEAGVLRGGVPLLKQKEAAYTRDSLGNQTADSAFTAMYGLAQLALEGKTGAIEELDKYAGLSEMSPKEAEAVAGKALDAQERALVDAYATWNRDMVRRKQEAAQSYGPSATPPDPNAWYGKTSDF